MSIRSPISAIPRDYLQPIQEGTLKFEWKGVLCCKNPFDFALYTSLIWREKPATIIEIGTYYGGSALWFADLTESFGLKTRIISIDIERFEGFADPRIDFRQGDAHRLEAALSEEEMRALPRPLLVIEDSSHRYETSLAVLRFFDRWLQKDEYILIEDGIMDSFDFQDQYEGGPNRALKQFLAETPGKYEIDEQYCDYFGRNVTWNTNGYLKRLTD